MDLLSPTLGEKAKVLIDKREELLGSAMSIKSSLIFGGGSGVARVWIPVVKCVWGQRKEER